MNLLSNKIFRWLVLAAITGVSAAIVWHAPSYLLAYGSAGIGVLVCHVAVATMVIVTAAKGIEDVIIPVVLKRRQRRLLCESLVRLQAQMDATEQAVEPKGETTANTPAPPMRPKATETAPAATNSPTAEDDQAPTLNEADAGLFAFLRGKADRGSANEMDEAEE